MICDKCGFEHNSKSVCPKCGARVVYVNEDYERRKREWEEAQKKGTAGAIPPGIMHSTIDEYNLRHGKDRMTHFNEEGRSETTGLSFVAIKEKCKAFFEKISGKFRKKRGANNPVIRKLEFSDEPETLDTSKLVLAHKIFKDKRKPIIIAAAAVVVLAVAIPVIVHAIKSTDRTKVYAYDGKYCYDVKNMDNALYGSETGAALYEGSRGNLMLVSNTAIILVGAGEAISVNKPEILTYNDDFSLVVYKSGGIVYIYNGKESVEIGTFAGEIVDDATGVSAGGKYFILTFATGNDDEPEYAMYYGSHDGITTVIDISSDAKTLISVDDDGKLIYLNMTTAEYGIVNEKNIVCYNGETAFTLIENAVDYMYVSHVLYCTDTDNYLYTYTEGKPVKYDEGVNYLTVNALDEEQVIYVKDDGYYLYEPGAGRKLFKSDYYGMTVYYNDDNEYLYCRYMNTMYFVQAVYQGMEPEKCFEISQDEEVIYFGTGNYILTVTADGKLMKLTSSVNELEQGASKLMPVANYDGYSYVTNDVRYIVTNKNGKKTKLISETNSVFTPQIVYSDKYFYYRDSNGELWKISSEKDYKIGLGYVEKCIFMG